MALRLRVSDDDFGRTDVVESMTPDTKSAIRAALATLALLAALDLLKWLITGRAL